MIKFIKQHETQTFDVRDLTARYTTDVTSKLLFNIDAQSFSNNPELFDLGKRIMKGISETAQSLMQWKWIPENDEKEFIRLTNELIEQRMKSSEIHDDFLSHIIAVKMKKNQDEIETAAHAWTFFLDSAETSAIPCYHALYELAKNQRVQQKLREEIENNSIDSITDLEYLDQVFYEVLRLHPPFMFTNRVCSEKVEIETSDGEKFTMEKGSTAMISIYSIHRNPEIYPEPEVFHPERFDGGRIKELKDQCFLMPFGEGPRICLGMRLGILLVKICMIEILKNFEISLHESTSSDPKISVTEFLNVFEGKIQLNFKSLKNI